MLSDQYELSISVDGVVKTGLSLSEKPSVVLLTLSKTATSSVTTVLGSKEIVVP